MGGTQSYALVEGPDEAVDLASRESAVEGGMVAYPQEWRAGWDAESQKSNIVEQCPHTCTCRGRLLALQDYQIKSVGLCMLLRKCNETLQRTKARDKNRGQPHERLPGLRVFPISSQQYNKQYMTA